MAGFESLAYAVRVPVVARYFGELLLGIVVMIAVTAGCALVAGDTDFAERAGLMLLLATAGALFCRRFPTQPDLQVNESLVVIALTFLVGSSLMVWPLMAGGLTFWDATLESVSALTTTGLSTVEDIEHQTPAFVFARAWMQWYGGLVIVVLALGLVVEPGPAAKRLFGAEMEGAGLIGGTRARVRRALVVYSALLVFGIALLLALGVGPFDALVHGLAAVSTGGFSSRDASIAGLGGPAVQIAVTVLCFCGAISLSLYSTEWRHGWKQLFADTELRAILLSVCLVTVILYLSLVLVDGRPWSDSIRVAPLLAFSAQTTSGFEAVRVADLGAASKATLILSMFIGGDMGSTAGGIKIVRFLLILRLVQLLLRRTCLPRHAVLELDGSDDRFHVREIMAMLAVIFLFIAAIVASWLIFLFYGFSPLDSLFEVVSALGTVGLSAGLTSSALPPLLKAVLCVDMLMGRVEVVAIVVLLYPRTWLGRRAEVV